MTPVSKNNANRREGGFTLVELILTVGILVILLGVVFVAVPRFMRPMMHAEAETTAKEIYVAAQNHLSVAKGVGLLKSAALGKQVGNKDDYYIVYGDYDDDGKLASPNALSFLLPPGSIDDSIRRGGSYIIRYQPKAGRILYVLYAKPNGLGGFFGSYGKYKFSEANFDNELAKLKEKGILDSDGYLTPDSTNKTINYDGAVIGSYGSEQAVKAAGELEKPEIEVENGDILAVTVNKNNSGVSNLKLVLVVEGAESKAMTWFDLSSTDDGDVYETASGSGKYIVTLDYATPTNSMESNSTYKHAMPFNKVIADRRSKERLYKNDIPINNEDDLVFLPGESLNVYAWVTSTKEVTGVARSSTSTPNSLFADGSSVSSITGKADVRIGSFRHLINLDRSRSFFNKKSASPDDTALLYMSTTVKVTQLTDLNWNDFAKDATDSDKSGDKTGYTSSVTSVNKSHFNPLNIDYKLAYKGNGSSKVDKDDQTKLVDGPVHRISNVTISTDGSAGLFSSLLKESTIDNLELVDFNVKSGNGAAGALVGELSDAVTITNVVAYDKSETSKIEGSTAAGGLVGSMTNGTVTESAAAVIVKATGGPAGGLIGSTNGTTVTKSYAAGHTKNGKYEEYDSGNANVTGSTNAGGLIGQAAGSSSVSQCYSTCSVKVSGDRGSAGGLIGSANGSNVAGSYATGVVGTATGVASGALVGAQTGGTIAGQYYSVANPAIKGVGTSGGTKVETDPSGVKPFDADMTSYDNFTTHGSDASPYDSWLIAAYNNKYIFKTIADMFEETERPTAAELTKWKKEHGTWLSTHYGDWGSYETLVVNTK